MINYNQLNLFKKLIYGIRARTNPIYDKIRFHKMRNLQNLFDVHAGTYRKDLSYRMSWFDVQHERTLAEWDNATDVIFGGQSTAELWFDQKNKCISYEGYVETKDKDRMVFYPFINFMRTHPAYAKIGPMRLLQVEAKTDGKPLEVHLSFRTFIKGEVNIYGFILSKSSDWHTYELPIQNMILRGTEQDFHDGPNPSGHFIKYFSKMNDSTIFDKDTESLKKMINSQIWNKDSIELSNVGFRLVSTQSQDRHIKIRNINFCYKQGFEKFVEDYRSPYFYITQDQVREDMKDSKTQKCKIQFLDSGLSDVKVIDTGDVKYFKNEKKTRR